MAFLIWFYDSVVWYESLANSVFGFRIVMHARGRSIFTSSVHGDMLCYRVTYVSLFIVSSGRRRLWTVAGGGFVNETTLVTMGGKDAI